MLVSFLEEEQDSFLSSGSPPINRSSRTVLNLRRHRSYSKLGICGRYVLIPVRQKAQLRPNKCRTRAYQIWRRAAFYHCLIALNTSKVQRFSCLCFLSSSELVTNPALSYHSTGALEAAV